MKRFDKTSYAVLLASIGILATAALWVWLQVTSPSDGARLQYVGPVSSWTEEGVYVTPLDEQSTPLQYGDMVIALDNQQIRYWAQNLLRADIHRPTWNKGQTVLYTVGRHGQEIQLKITLGNYPLASLLRLQWVNFFSFFLILGIGWLVFYQRPTVRAAQLLYLSNCSLVSSLVIWALSSQVYDVIYPWRFWIYRSGYLLGFLNFGLLLHFAMTFPKNQAALFNRVFKLLVYAGIPLGFIAGLSLSRTLTHHVVSWVSEISVIGDRMNLVLHFILVAAFVNSYRVARSDSIDLERALWCLGGLLVTVVLVILLNGLPKLFWGEPLLTREKTGLLMLPFSLGMAVAIMRFHLFDIHILINRALVYGILTATVVIGYVVAVGWLGTLFEAHGNIWISLIVTGVVAVAFQPLRERVQRGVNRLMYGERDDPYAVLARLSRRLGTAVTPDVVLPAVVETIAQALKLPYVAISLEHEGSYHIAAEYGNTTSLMETGKGKDGNKPIPSPGCLDLPLIYQSEKVGHLILSPRAPGDNFTSSDIRFLEEVASQAGAVAYSVRLTADLQRSRERLVTAREEERRRLRRDLHDGIGSILASLAFNLDAASNLLDRDPVATRALIKELKLQTQTAMADIRRLAYDLRPPVLDELGFIASLQEYIKGISCPDDLCIELNTPEEVDSLPAAIEVAAYRITVEALNNVIRHANAHCCIVNIAMNNARTLTLEIIDDGRGLPVGWFAGVGISGMRERASELGGTFEIKPNAEHGTRINVMLPLSKE